MTTMVKDIQIQTGDFRQLSAQLADNSIDAIVTDPPYPEKFLPLWSDLGRVAARVLKPSAFLVAYSGQFWLDRVMVMLSNHLDYYTQMINAEPGAHGRIMARAMFQEWKPILVYSKSPLKRCHKWGPNVVVSPAPSKRHHKWGQSVEPVRELVERFTKTGDLVLDPFLGGGTTALACFQTGRRCIGYEIEPDVAELARERIAGAQMPLFSGELMQQASFVMEGGR